jgi:hypothetical protein
MKTFRRNILLRNFLFSDWLLFYEFYKFFLSNRIFGKKFTNIFFLIHFQKNKFNYAANYQWFKGSLKEFDFEKIDGVVEQARAIKEAFKPKVGLAQKEFNEFIDRQLNGKPNNIETYNSMSKEQQGTVQEIKKALARISYKQSK